MDTQVIIICVLFVIILLHHLSYLKYGYDFAAYYLFRNNAERIPYVVPVGLPLLTKASAAVDKLIEENVKQNIPNPNMQTMLLYALSDGKKLRPVLMQDIYKTLNPSGGNINDLALSVEYIHTASLILDDIMDDDATRRGKTSFYIKYGVSTAQLSAIVLCAFAMRNAFNFLLKFNEEHPDANKDIPLVLGSVVFELLQNLGVGQYIDITLPTNLYALGDNIKTAVQKNNVDIDDLIHKKTSSLFELCFIVPLALTNYTKRTADFKNDLQKMRTVAQYFGLMFQIADDFEDVDRDSNRNGKNSAMNYVLVKGYNEAFSVYTETSKNFVAACKQYHIFSDLFQEITTYLDAKVKVYYENDKP